MAAAVLHRGVRLLRPLPCSSHLSSWALFGGSSSSRPHDLHHRTTFRAPPSRAIHAPPRALDAIVKLDLLREEPRERIEEIWRGYHAEREHTLAEVWSSEEYEAFKVAVQTAGPLFLYPVPRDGGYFVLISQTVGDGASCLYTYLEDFRQDPANAVPYLSIVFYTELAGSPGDSDSGGSGKGIVLVRGDVTPGALELDECRRLLGLTRSCYQDKLLDVRCFNQGDPRFDFEKHIADLLEK